MSSCPGVRCDRCSTRALLDNEERSPHGWSTVRVQREDPFMDTGYVDLCNACTHLIMKAMDRADVVTLGSVT